MEEIQWCVSKVREIIALLSYSFGTRRACYFLGYNLGMILLGLYIGVTDLNGHVRPVQFATICLLVAGGSMAFLILTVLVRGRVDYENFDLPLVRLDLKFRRLQFVPLPTGFYDSVIRWNICGFVFVFLGSICIFSTAIAFLAIGLSSWTKGIAGVTVFILKIADYADKKSLGKIADLNSRIIEEKNV